MKNNYDYTEWWDFCIFWCSYQQQTHPAPIALSKEAAFQVSVTLFCLDEFEETILSGD